VILLDQILRVSQFPVVQAHVPLRSRDIRVAQEPAVVLDPLFPANFPSCQLSVVKGRGAMESVEMGQCHPFSRKPAESMHPILRSLPRKNGWHFPQIALTEPILSRALHAVDGVRVEPSSGQLSQ
jgi:hypothetical protein